MIKFKRRIAIILTYLAMGLLSVAEKNNAGAVEIHFWKPAFEKYFKPRLDECDRANRKMAAQLTQIGDIANEAILNPNDLDDRQVLAMVVEIVRSLD